MLQVFAFSTQKTLFAYIGFFPILIDVWNLVDFRETFPVVKDCLSENSLHNGFGRVRTKSPQLLIQMSRTGRCEDNKMNDMALIGLGALSLLLGAVMLVGLRRNTERKGTDYRGLFIVGIVFLPVGYFFDFPILLFLGLVYILIGFVNRDKWGNPRKELSINSPPN